MSLRLHELYLYLLVFYFTDSSYGQEIKTENKQWFTFWNGKKVISKLQTTQDPATSVPPSVDKGTWVVTVDGLSQSGKTATHVPSYYLSGDGSKTLKPSQPVEVGATVRVKNITAMSYTIFYGVEVVGNENNRLIWVSGRYIKRPAGHP